MTEHRHCRIYPWRTLAQIKAELCPRGWKLLVQEGDWLTFVRRAG